MPIYPYSFQLPPLNVQDIPNDGVAGEFLGISAGGVLDWLPVSASGSGDMLKSENLSGLADYPTARTNLGLGTGDSPTFKNLTISTGTIATSAPVTISQTWDALAVAFTAFKVNAVSTASEAASLLADFQVGGVSQLNVAKNGTLKTNNVSSLSTFQSLTLTGKGGSNLFFDTGVIYTNSSFVLDSASLYLAFNRDTILVRDGAANTLALRNGAAAQTFNVYGTYSTSPSLAYSRLAIACDTSGNATLTTQSTGTAGTVSINGVPVGQGKATAAQNALSLALGVDSLVSNTTGSNNIAIGHSALKTVTTGAYNVGIGYEAISGGTVSFESVAVGYQAGKGNVGRQVSIGYGADTVGPSSDGVSVGWAAMYSVVSGSLNVAVGRNGGRFITGGSTSITSCTKSLFLGCDTKALGQGQENQIVIGYDATGLGSNTAVLGNASITTTALRGNVGIGTTAPTSKLHVAETWNNAGTAFTAMQVAVTNTNSASGSKIFDLLSGTVTPTSKFSVDRDGFINVAYANGRVFRTFSGANGFNLLAGPFTGDNLIIERGDAAPMAAFNTTGFTCISELRFAISVGSFNVDTILRREDEADHLAMRRTTNGQKFSVYGTYPGASTWERFTITAPTSGNVLLGTYRATSGVARGLEIQTNGATAIDIGANGNIGIGVAAGASKLNVTGSVDVTLLRSGFYVQAGTQFMFGTGGTGDVAMQRNAAGVMEINSTTAGTFRDLRVRSVIQQPPASITPASNGDYVVEATNNTTLTFRLRGSDGVVRSATLTLAP